MSNKAKNQLRDIMLQAHTFIRKNGMSLSEALKCAWANAKLRAAMTTRIVKFYFLKLDGTTREAYGTLKADIVPATLDSGRKPNPSVQVYFDTERGEHGEWRCFKKANLLRIA
ncbi:MAG: SH3 beta-barrel fold-containing protein [Prevotella sp.]|nr:SH3 beta-barrel fold-containing protein [Prevotella sp.]